MKCIRIFSFLIFLTISFYSVSAQNNGCNGLRYKNEVFDIVKVTTAIYGRNVGLNLTHDTIDLFMDVYEPMGDQVTSRPAIILAFGGAYISGDRIAVNSTVFIPKKLNTNFSPCLAEILNFPSKSVWVPIVVPLTRTLTPGIGKPA